MTHTHPGRIISKIAYFTVLYTNIVVAVHTYRVIEGTHQHALICCVVGEIRRNAGLLAGTGCILGVVGARAGQPAVVVGQVGVVRCRAVDDALPGWVIGVHRRSCSKAFIFAVVSSVVGIQVWRTKLDTSTYI